MDHGTEFAAAAAQAAEAYYRAWMARGDEAAPAGHTPDWLLDRVLAMDRASYTVWLARKELDRARRMQMVHGATAKLAELAARWEAEGPPSLGE